MVTLKQLILGCSVLIACCTYGVGAASAETVTLMWTYDLTKIPRQHSGFQLGRCTLVPPATACTNYVDVPNGAVGATILTWTDTTAVANAQYCYGVQALPLASPAPGMPTARSAYQKDPACGTVTPSVLAAPTALRIVVPGTLTVKAGLKNTRR